MEKLIEEFSIGLFFWQTVIFVLLIFLLKKYAWGPILKAVNDREQGIKDALQSAELAKEEMESLKADNDKIMKQARVDRDSLLKEKLSDDNKQMQIVEELLKDVKLK
jgi:F-type H+-transporting ATPase subunit b